MTFGITVYTKLDNIQHSALLDISSESARPIMAVIRDAVDMYIDHYSSTQGKTISVESAIDREYRRILEKERAKKKILSMRSSPHRNDDVISALMNQANLSEEELDSFMEQPDTPRNNCRYFLMGILSSGSVDSRTIYERSFKAGFSKRQTQRSLSDIADAKLIDGVHCWEIR